MLLFVLPHSFLSFCSSLHSLVQAASFLEVFLTLLVRLRYSLLLSQLEHECCCSYLLFFLPDCNLFGNRAPVLIHLYYQYHLEWLLAHDRYPLTPPNRSVRATSTPLVRLYYSLFCVRISSVAFNRYWVTWGSGSCLFHVYVVSASHSQCHRMDVFEGMNDGYIPFIMISLKILSGCGRHGSWNFFLLEIGSHFWSCLPLANLMLNWPV